MIIVRASRFEAWANLFVKKLFEKIHEAYLARSNGDADKTGYTWPDLAINTKRTIPLTPQEQAAFGPRERGLLTPGQNRLWKHYFWTAMQEFERQNVEVNTAKKYAAKLAWSGLKRLGALTMLRYAKTRKVPIMIRSGTLLQSLAPGEVVGGQYNPPDHQIVEITRDYIRIGTSVPYAEKLARTRKLWPPNVSSLIALSASEASLEV